MALPLITAHGTPDEIGHSYGSQAAAMVSANVDVYRRRFTDPAGPGLAGDEVRAAGREFRDRAAECHPRVVAMLDGLAAGAGVDRDDLYALNARTELLYGTEECTSVAVLGSHTADGHTLLGQNWDWYPDSTALVLSTTDERGLSVVALAEAGMLAKAGLNSYGLGVCVNLLGCERDGRPGGAPYHVLLRAVLEAPSMALALRTACLTPRSASINLLIGQPPEAIDVELVPGDAAWLEPRDGLLTHANHFSSRLPVHDRLHDLGGSSPFRPGRLRRLLEPAAAERKVGLDTVAEALCDHFSYPHAICRHVDENDSELERSCTAASVLMDLDALRIGVTPGAPCRTEYTWHTVRRDRTP